MTLTQRPPFGCVLCSFIFWFCEKNSRCTGFGENVSAVHLTRTKSPKAMVFTRLMKVSTGSKIQYRYAESNLTDHHYCPRHLYAAVESRDPECILTPPLSRSLLESSRIERSVNAARGNQNVLVNGISNVRYRSAVVLVVPKTPFFQRFR